MTNVKKTGRARLQLKLGAPFTNLPLAVQAHATGYSEGHIRQILRGQQIGEPFIAAVLCAWPAVPFDRQFEAIPGVNAVKPLPEPEVDVPSVPDIEPPEGMPRSYEEALGMGHELQQGPPLFPGSDDHEPDRIVLYENDVPVLAFEPGFIRTYAVTRDHEPSMQLLAYYGHTEWTGNRIKI